MALSSTLAAPSTTSPSAAICSPAFTKNKSPRLRVAPGTSKKVLWLWTSSNLWADTSFFEARRESAWALPRPSAMASAKLEKRQVSHRMTAMARINPLVTMPSEIPPKERANNTVVSSAERYTRNMTGFLTCSRGSSLVKESFKARISMERRPDFVSFIVELYLP